MVTRKKKILLRFLVAASICVVASWAVFSVKPAWWGDLKGRLFSSAVAPKKRRAESQSPSRPVFKVVPPQRINPSPPMTPAPGQQPQMVERMERPQPAAPGMPPAMSTSSSLSTYPVTRPQVSTPGAPPAIPPSSTYPYAGTRPEVSAPEGAQRTPIIASSSLSKKKEDSESDEYLEIATLYAQKGKYEKAEELFHKVARENPSSAKAHNNLGFVYLRQQKYEVAEREFKEAMRLNPAFTLPYYNLACLYTRKGMDVEALIYLKRALKRDARVKAWALSDDDLASLKSDAVFQELLGSEPQKKEDAQKKEDGLRQEGVQKREGTQKREIPQQDSALKQGIYQNQKPQTEEGAQKPAGALTGGAPKKKEVVPPQMGPPLKENAQRQEGTQGNTTGNTTGNAQNQLGPQDGAQSQQGPQGGVPDQKQQGAQSNAQQSTQGAQGAKRGAAQ